MDTVNAFALPDGSIVLLDGLVSKMNDDEVIAMLAHKFGHVYISPFDAKNYSSTRASLISFY